MFIDRVKLKLKAGKGGDGLVCYRREKYVPLGGPSGGDGGDGGSIIFEVDENKSTLLDLRYNKHIVAKDGGKGKVKKMHGATADDFIIRVPLGTIIIDEESNKIIADLTKQKQRATICQGGRGGRGNFRFATSRNPAPDFAENGAPGEEKNVIVELKLLADAGLVGFPSVGKSTFLSCVSKARPEIAAYHFTTIVPNLGMVQVKDGRSFVLADLPGLIKGASEGKGLGHNFLKHIERCRVIIHVIDMGASEGRDPIVDYETIQTELGNYQYRLLERPQVIVANKMDLDGAQENLARFKEYIKDKAKVFPVCTLTREGLDPVLYEVRQLLDTTSEFPLYDEEENQGVVYKYVPEQAPFTVINQGNGNFELKGYRLEKAFKMTNFQTDEGALRFARQLKSMGVDEALAKAGAKDGDIIHILDYQFVYVE